MMIVIQAWVKGSPNVVPIAQCETRSFTVAMSVARAFAADGFRVERFEREEPSDQPAPTCVGCGEVEEKCECAQFDAERK